MVAQIAHNLLFGNNINGLGIGSFVFGMADEIGSLGSFLGHVFHPNCPWLSHCRAMVFRVYW